MYAWQFIMPTPPPPPSPLTIPRDIACLFTRHLALQISIIANEHNAIFNLEGGF